MALLEQSLFAGTLSMTATLVNESRARRSDLSGDIFAHDWIPASDRPALARLWNEYAEQVYPHDDIVLSVRNRFFLDLLKANRNKDYDCFIAPCGLTSYPFLTRFAGHIFELDLRSVVDYKKRRASWLIKRNVLPNRSVTWDTLDLESSADLSGFISAIRKRRRKIIILEGISYYLRSKVWWSLLHQLLDCCQRGDIIAFDYWPWAERGKPIYKRFLNFCSTQGAYSRRTFNFLDISQLSRFKAASQVLHRSVVDYESEAFHSAVLRKKPILRDTYVILTV